ncbi:MULTISPECIES: phosphate ABC transporter substrate-binding protein [unclassified Paenibacillus]|uniref:phosphate ABC transporter substrate-binding protein n=1 Tax=unclassified Paenibacillus TaxID=185978 RepID=UPI0024072D41|nr:MULTISPECIES: phosphate ABC transporter substrate-binding protein [unclassified Paenibacillus]MDF9841189.1 phosphate transport system substrate-binding protein [Paenibacillus sp. PastF-2]MDF9847639.1 phosphate transport system substrate-binding protein [Paenibacillus sp. PastM-2]MDF9854208.1 phosphate transport system substrate-binding protein [Paenibacillus sp. PastF-1]MDH6479621.1 phosphate transport system substrate-binding protein [Paenibacillus sp. PastH-2]MDH6505286.1 phosphate transp
MQFRKSWIMALALTSVVALSACGNSNNAATNNGGNNAAATNTPTENSSGAELNGSILASGSTALQPLVEQAAESFMDANSGVDIQVQGGGSGTGLTQVAEGQVDIGNSDVFAEDKLKDADAEKAAALVDHQVAVVAIAAVTNPNAGVDNLTQQQLVDIFTGKITNWSEVGGADQAIQIINRPSSSGTRATFEAFALGTKTEDLQGSIQEDSSGTVKKMIGETPGAIGYLALSYLDDTVKTLNYDGVVPSVDNVVSGEYPVWAYEHMYTNGEPNEVVKAFLDYMLTDEVQNGDVVELGYIPANAMQVSRDVDGNVTKK